MLGFFHDVDDDDSRVVYHVVDFLTGNCTEFNGLRATELYGFVVECFSRFVLCCCLSDVISRNTNVGMCLSLSDERNSGKSWLLYKKCVTDLSNIYIYEYLLQNFIPNIFN